MFEYKDKEFYTAYFNNLEDFELVREFDLSKENDEKNLYVGMIKAKECIHPLEIRVEIPVTFPHNKLMFRTLSLFGYPHLIDNGETKHGSWFCLNTPFGETAENQLNLEMYRLREWMKRQLREDLPAKITDSKFSAALHRANAYEWEILDEVNEFQTDALLTFLGNQALDISEKESVGYLHCIKTKDNRFFVVRNKDISNSELPYVVVNRFPSEANICKDVINLSKFYEWNDEVLKHILPEMNLKYEWQASSSFGYKGNYDEAESLHLLGEIQKSLADEECKLKVKKNKNISLCPICDSEKNVIREEIEFRVSEVKKGHGYGIKYNKYFNSPMTDEEAEEEDMAIWEHNKSLCTFHYFALGIRIGEEIQWLLCQTNRASIKCEVESIDIGICWIDLKRPYACNVCWYSAQTIDEKQFFGRGMFSEFIRYKKIAIVGLGAIGSMVAESLARSGVTAIGLWDNDLVAPGNICRSTFRIQDIGQNKGQAIKNHLAEINPYVKIEEIKVGGYWQYREYDVNYCKYMGGSFYDNVNYNSQEKAISMLADYDMIIDCTGSNELLHFISYAAPDKDIVSLCITNHAKNLLMFSNRDGNPFELRKAYLSKIEQDTKNFYLEGTGCYSPTFLATNSSIAALVNMAVGRLNEGVEANDLHSVILSYDKRGVIADQLCHYKLKEHDITMTIGSETMMDGEDIAEAEDGILGFVFGSYSADGKQIMITHIVPAGSAKEQLDYTFQTSKGIIDYIGDLVYSRAKPGTFSEDALATIESKAFNPNINTNNPLLEVRNPEGTLSFFLYLNGELIPFESTQA